MVIEGRSTMGKAIQKQMAKIIKEGKGLTRTFSGRRYYTLHDMEVLIDEDSMVLMNRTRNEGKLRVKWTAMLSLRTGYIYT